MLLFCRVVVYSRSATYVFGLLIFTFLKWTFFKKI